MSTIQKSLFVNGDVISNTKKQVLSKTNINFCMEYEDGDSMVLKNRNKKSDLHSLHNTVIRHADMPKAILKRLWVQLHSKRNTVFVNKNPMDDGGYYWVIMDFQPKFNIREETFFFFVKRMTPTKQTIKEISTVYKKLLSIEQTMGLEVSAKYLTRFLEERKQTFDELIKEMVKL